MFGHHLDGLTDTCRLLFVDLRSQGRSLPSEPATWTLTQLAADIDALAATLELERYAVLGHSFGAFVALQHAADFAGRPAASVVSAGLPSARFLTEVERNLAAFEPVELREQVTQSWAREAEARTQEDCRSIMSDQLPFHFRDPHDPRIDDMRAAFAEMTFAPDVMREAARSDYGGLEVEERLPEITHPVLVLAGRHDRTCSVAGADAIVQGVPDGELVVFENSGHMMYAEEEDAYVSAVRDFLVRHVALQTV
jgi:proline iminopeptidase